MEDTPDRRIPTGIASLDPVLDGGVPPGSVILLLGDIGAGNTDFVRSSAIFAAKKKRESETEQEGEILYITITRIRDDILDEAAKSVSADLYTAMETGVRFEDLSELYFDASVVPVEWYSTTDILSRMQNSARREDLLGEFAALLSRTTPASIIYVDSLTDLAAQANTPEEWRELTALLRGIQRVSKVWGSVVYLPLTRGVLPPNRELEIQDITDAVVLFRWEETQGMRRQRTMYFQKFRGVMPNLEERDLVKFAVKITSGGGFEVSNIRVVI
ncbi:RAD55 family ATPase [Methanofollis fontis]|uniref:KaiC-like domain-containing protein n=1 Tax=Methanofollis fontis TaxID=2052832 RepID=A0A483CZH5_9EURY|nr:ATPase domain-containing protein [Methanofollis fontis]TAJ45782.1 hypothetical protein CUJ86_03475 [Methanofollis fontis]